ncbi:MAG: hypothetical protein JWM21_2011 [Acidobacteria bacterium]|nr:hypothetical protein [Acidobacteriota bacterium]
MGATIAIDKTALLEGIIRTLEEEIKTLRASFDEAKLTSIEAPGRMQSRYDTMGVEAAWVADGLAKSIEEKAEGTYRLKNVRLPDSPERVSIGCIVGIGPEGSAIENLYFILPACGGMSIPIDNSNLTLQTVMLQAPVARALIGKSLDDEVNVRRGRTTPDFILYLA